MGDILDKIFAIILVVILMFFFPLLDAFERIDDLSYMTVYAATVKFVDAVRTTGHISPEMYSEFLEKLNSTGNKYSVEMLHKKSMYYPENDKINNQVVLEEGHGSIYLDEEFNTEQILFAMGYYTYDATTNKLKESIPQRDYINFSVGDYFYVTVQNTSPTPATVIKRVIYGNNMTDLTIMVPYGGLVQNDSNDYLQEQNITTVTIVDPPVVEEPPVVEPPVVEPPIVEEPEVIETTLASVANVGDYVNYIPQSAVTQTLIYKKDAGGYYYTYEGNNYSQVIRKINNIKWQVLKNNGNQVTLISETPLNDGGFWYCSDYRTYSTTNIYAIDDIYKLLYSNGSIGTGRNLNQIDLLEIFGGTDLTGFFNNPTNYADTCNIGTFLTASYNINNSITNTNLAKKLIFDSSFYMYWITYERCEYSGTALQQRWLYWISPTTESLCSRCFYDNSWEVPFNSVVETFYGRPVVELNANVIVNNGNPGNGTSGWNIELK